MNARAHVVIVGGGPAGLSTARSYRQAGGRARVTLLAAERHAPYLRPPLTKEYLRGELDRAELPIESPPWFAEQGVTLRHAEAVALDVDRRRLGTADGDELRWDGCVLATGSRPARLPIPGAERDDVLVMRTVEDADRLAERVGCGPIAVLGSGFIGCEAAASLAIRGADVAVLGPEEVPQAERLGDEAGARLAGWLAELGVELALGCGVSRIEPAKDGGVIVWGEDGRRREAATAVMGAGVEPRLELARAAGLEIAEEGTIAVDAGLATAADGVWAAGDIACADHPRAGRRLRVEHWGEALHHGEVAGRALAGEPARWDVAPGFWSTIGEHTIKHVAWGDGFDEARLVEGEDGAFTVFYGRDGTTVGVLTHERDEDYERGRALVEAGAPLP